MVASICNVRIPIVGPHIQGGRKVPGHYTCILGGRKVPGHYTCIFNKTQYFLMKHTETYIFNKKENFIRNKAENN